MALTVGRFVLREHTFGKSDIKKLAKTGMMKSAVILTY
jgi:hypothetical protein